MFEKPYNNETYRCAGCGYPITEDCVPDAKSDREDPSYYHLGCFIYLEKEREASKQPSNPRLHSSRREDKGSSY